MESGKGQSIEAGAADRGGRSCPLGKGLSLWAQDTGQAAVSGDAGNVGV